MPPRRSAASATAACAEAWSVASPQMAIGLTGRPRPQPSRAAPARRRHEGHLGAPLGQADAEASTEAGGCTDDEDSQLGHQYRPKRNPRPGSRARVRLGEPRGYVARVRDQRVTVDRRGGVAAQEHQGIGLLERSRRLDADLTAVVRPEPEPHLLVGLRERRVGRTGADGVDADAPLRSGKRLAGDVGADRLLHRHVVGLAVLLHPRAAESKSGVSRSSLSSAGSAPNRDPRPTR